MSLAIQKTKDKYRLQVKHETILFLFMVGLIFFIRITNLNYNTLFVDEAANLLAGHDALIGRFDRDIVTWFGGSFLYPLLATFADNLGGVWGVRLVSAVFTTATAVFVYLASQRLFEKQTALWAMAIYGLTGASISLGQMAVYDVLCLPFLALTFYLLVEAAKSEGHKERNYLIAAAFSFSLSAVGKYTAVFYLPALGLVSILLYWTQLHVRKILKLVLYFLLPLGGMIGFYVYYNFYDLVQLFTTQGYESAGRWEVFRVIWEEIGIASILAIIGLAALPWVAQRSKGPGSDSMINIISTFLHSRKNRMLAIVGMAGFFLIVLIPSFLSLPLYHLAGSNIRSLWKHTNPSLIFLSPFAGYAIALSIQHLRRLSLQRSLTVRILGAALTMLGVFGFANYGLNRNWGFQHSWPNIQGAVEFIRASGFEKNSHMLVEGGAAFEYYFGTGKDARGQWSDTWFTSYAGLQGIDAMEAAIRDRYFDFVVLDGNSTPELTSQLITVLREAGYTIGYENVQQLTIGTRRVRVYTK